MKLYEINRVIEEVINRGYAIDEETGELLFSSEDLEQLQIDRSDKIEGIALTIKNYLALADDIKAEEQNLKARREATTKKAQWLENYLTEMLNGEKFETAKAQISFRKSVKVIVDEGVQLPEEYIKTTVKTEPNKTAIKNAIKDGAEIIGCRLEESQNIQIK